MPTFRYTFEDANRQLRQAELQAADLESARQALAARGIRPIQVFPATDHESPARLSGGEATEVAVVLAEVSDSQLPMAEGLRAAAMECANRKVARALQVIADDVELGRSLETVIDQRGSWFPNHVRGILTAAAGTSQFGAALDELLEFHRENREAWSRVVATMTYPIVVLMFAVAILAVMPFTIVPQIQNLFSEFELTLPETTQAVFGLSDLTRWLVLGEGQWVLWSGIAVVIATCVMLRIIVGAALVPRLVASAPLVGDMWQWNSVAAFMRLLAMMLDLGIPLPRALELTADGLADPMVSDAARRLAHGAGQGRSLSELIWNSRQLPMSIAPFVQWGEKTGQLPDALRTVNDMFLARVRMRAMVVRLIGPTAVFFLVGFVISVCVLALFSPMVQMIQLLT